MKLVILLSLAVFAAAAAESTLTSDNYYGYAFKPQPQHTYHSDEPFTLGLSAKLKTWAQRFPAIKSLIDSQTSALPVELQRVINKGYSHYSQSAAVEVVEGVDADGFDAFAAYIVDSLGIAGDQRDGFLASLELIKYADNTDWSLVDIIFSQRDSSNCKYACVLGHRNLAQNTYDIVIADFKTGFQLAPGILLIEERKSYLWGLDQTANNRVERIPTAQKLQDVKLLKSFFSQAAMVRFAQMLDVTVPGLDEAFAFLSAITGIINAGIDVISQKILGLFKTTSTSAIVKEVTGVGLSHYVQNSKANFFEDVTRAKVNSMMPILPRLLELSLDIFEGVKSAITIGMFTEKSTWSDFKIVYSQNNTGSNQVKFVDVICNNRGNDTFNLIIVSATQSFKLAPNVKYIRNDKSYVGGIYSKTKIERQEYPRSLTEKDMDVLVGFFHIAVYKKLAAMKGMSVPNLPDKPPIK